MNAPLNNTGPVGPPAFGSKDLAKIAGRLDADETMHFTILTNALGRPLPVGALTFGA